MADSTALNILISADTTQMVSSLNNAKQQLASFSSTGASSLQGFAQSTQAANDATAAFEGGMNKVSAATEKAKGGTREMRESVESLRTGLMGVGDATDLVSVGLANFASGLGGPMVLAASLAVAAIGVLVQELMKTVDGQTKLQATAAEMDLPTDQIDSYTKSLMALQQQLTDVKLGFSNLTDAQKDMFQKLGLDPSKTDAGQVFASIYNSKGSEQDKIKAYAIATNTKPDAATQAWSENVENINAPYNGSQTETVGMHEGIIGQGFGGTDVSSLLTQNQVDNTTKQTNELQSLQEKINDIKKQGEQAQNDAISDPAQKILADAQQKIKDLQAALANFKQEVAKDKDLTPDQASSTISGATSATNATIAQVRAAALAQAKVAEASANASLQPIDLNQYQAQIDKNNASVDEAHQEALAQAQSVKDMATELSNVGSAASTQADLKSATTQANQILIQAQDKIKELDQKLAGDIDKINGTKGIDQGTKTSEIAKVQGAHDSSVTQINAAAQTLIKQSSPVQQMFKQWSDSSTQFQQTFVEGMQDMAQGLTSFIMTGKMNFTQFADSIISDLIRIALEKEVAGIFGSLLGSFGGGVTTPGAVAQQPFMSGASTPFSTGFNSTGLAGGGTTQAGVPTMVGERGPELFVPNTAGQIINASNVGSSSPSNFNVSVVNQSSTQVKAKNAKPTQTGKDMMIQVFLDDLNRGGPMSSGMTQAFGLSRSTLT